MNDVVVPVNYVAVLAAAVLSMAIGFLWYGPLFGKAWTKEMGWSKSDIEKAKAKGMGKEYGLMMLGSLVMSYVLAHSVVFAQAYMGATGLMAGALTGFWSWLGFIAPMTYSLVIFEGRSKTLWMLTNGYYLVSLVTMGVLLGVWV